MNKHLYMLAVLALGLNACGPTYVLHQDPPPVQDPPPPPPPAPASEVSYQSFYDELAPYGQWIDDPNYGYVWMPGAGPDFKPYATNGHWVYTEEGWAWASDYQWGWATFHYGRWFFRDGYGWMWIPGHEWAPAWVSWRRSPDYYGWAPLGPNVSISVSIGGGYNPPAHYWCFVPNQYVTSPHINNYYVNEQRNVTIINNTTVINNTVINNNNTNITNNNIRNTNITNNNVTNNNYRTVNYAGGPDPNEVSRYTGAAVRPVPVRTSAAPGERSTNNSFAIYRPRVTAVQPAASGNGGTLPRPAPARVQPLENVRPMNAANYNNYRPANNQPQPVSGGIQSQQANSNGAMNSNRGMNPNWNNNNYNNGNNGNNGGNFGRPGSNPSWRANQPAGQPVSQPVREPVNQQPQQPAQQPFYRPGMQPASQPGGQPAFRPAAQTAQPGAQTAQPGAQAAQPGRFNRGFQPAQQPAPGQPRANNNEAPARPGMMRPVAPAQQQQQPATRPVTRDKDGNREVERKDIRQQ